MSLQNTILTSLHIQVDLDEIKNRGLETPIAALTPLVDKYDALLSRADIWAMATLVGADVQQPSGFRVDFTFDSWGRRNCEGKTR